MMRSVLLAAGATAAFGLCSEVHAQGTTRPATKPAEGGGPAPAVQGQPRAGGAFFEDPSFRLRALKMEVSGRGMGGLFGGGGRGGRDGGRGPQQSAMGNTGNPMIPVLLRTPALQEEIGLSEDQKKKLEEISRQSRDRQREMFQNAFGNMANAQQGRQRGQGGERGNRFDPQQMQQMQQAMMALRAESEAAVNRILTKAQAKRLNEIRLQIIGPMAVVEEPIVQALQMTPDQYQRIQQIIAAYDEAMGQQIRNRFEGMRQTFGQGGPGGFGPGGQQGQGPGGAAAAAGGRRGGGGEEAEVAQNAQGRPQQPRRGGDDPEDERTPEQRRQDFMNSPQFQQMQTSMQQAAEEQDKLLKQTEAEIGKVLMSAQKRNFNKMLGEPYDLTLLVQNMGPGGPGGQRFGGRRGAEGEFGGGQAAAARPNPAGAATATRPAATPDPAPSDNDQAPAEDSRPARPRPRVRGAGGQ